MQSSKGHVHLTNPSYSTKLERTLARTEQEEKLEIERRKAVLTESKMMTKMEKAAQKLDAKQSHHYYGHRKRPTDRYHGHQPKGSNARETERY